MRGERAHFPVCGRGRERQRRERASSFSLRSTKLRWSDFVEPRTKVRHIDEGYAWVPRMRDFTEDQRRKVGKSKLMGLGGFLPIILRSKR